MTEAEWQSCTDPAPMLEALRGKASGRKLRLKKVVYHIHVVRRMNGRGRAGTPTGGGPCRPAGRPA